MPQPETTETWHGPGYLEVGAVDGQVVVYVPRLDHHIAFSPMEAVQLANLILAKAHEVVHG